MKSDHERKSGKREEDGRNDEWEKSEKRTTESANRERLNIFKCLIITKKDASGDSRNCTIIRSCDIYSCYYKLSYDDTSPIMQYFSTLRCNSKKHLVRK